MGRRRRRSKQSDSLGGLVIALATLITGYIGIYSPLQEFFQDDILIKFFVLWLVVVFVLGLLMFIALKVWRRIHPQSQALTDTFAFEQPISYRDFEHEVASLIQTLTGHKTEVIGGAGDGGVDIKVFDGKELVGIVQCKRYTERKALPPSFIREMYTCKQSYGVKTAYLVTTAWFSKESEREAQRLGIKLVGGDELNRMRLKAREQIRVP